MCGIVGIFGGGEQPAVHRQRVARMNETLVHRGPDDAGTAAGQGWAIGMRRLAVQDLSRAGHQPMERGDLSIVFNGEVYNFPQLRRELSGHGAAFTSGTDTEVVLRSFERWGTDAFARFNGMFALAIVDRRAGRAWLARDRFGKKPLFVARLRDRVVVASELKAILAEARAELTLDRAALAAYFRYQYVPAPASIFAEVRKQSPATWAEIDCRTGEVGPETPYWQLPAAGTGPVATPQETLAVVQEAVRRRLVADVPLGAFLSGGTDSSLVVGCMTQVTGDVRTFSIGFADPRYDESRYAAAVARHFGTDHTEMTLTEADALEIVPSLPEYYDEPFADSSAIPTTAVARLARQHVTVALSGDGGDEMFGGYPRYGATRYLRAMVRAPSAVARLEGVAGRLPRIGSRAARVTAMAATRSPGEGYRELVAVWHAEELSRLIPEGNGGDPFAARFDAGPGSPLTRMMRTDARTYLIDDILQKVDRASMSVSLEARNPLLDPDVVELGMRSAAAAEAAPGAKPLLRGALRELLPDELVDRPKMGFGLPIGAWMRTELRPLVEDLVLARAHPEYDAATARRVCAEHLDGRRDRTPMVWALLAYELWRERWLS